MGLPFGTAGELGEWYTCKLAGDGDITNPERR